MAFLNREELLKKEQFKVERVDFPNGDFVFVRQMSSKMKDTLENSILKKITKGGKIEFEQDLTGFSAKLAALSLCDEEGNLLLSLKDADLLADNKPAAMIDLIATKAGVLNGISVEAKAEAVKNSESDQPEDSSSGCVES
jgi:hypothetical protein